MRQHHRALAKIVEGEAGENKPEPGHPDRRFSEMSHVGIQRLGAGHAQEHRAKHDEGGRPVRHKESEGMRGIQRCKDRRIIADMHQAERGEHQKPDRHQGPEHKAHLSGAARLRGKQHDQYTDGHRLNPVRVELRDRKLQAFNGGENRNGGRQDGVAIEQRGPGNAQHEHRPRPPANRMLRQRHQ